MNNIQVLRLDQDCEFLDFAFYLLVELVRFSHIAGLSPALANALLGKCRFLKSGVTKWCEPTAL
jgi:hypothetical protein